MCIRDRDTSVHHIVPLVEDYEKRLDDDNLITLCSRHHEMAEKGDIDRRELLVSASSSGRVILLLSSISTLFLHIAHCDKGNEKFGGSQKNNVF